MVASRRIALAGLAGAAIALAACDALLGLDQYRDVDCAFDCAAETGFVAPPPDAADATDAHDASDASDGTTDADADAPDGDGGLLGDVVISDGAWPPPTGHELWAHWPMPNPDASIAPDSSALLPNQMAYDAGAEGGSPIAYDEVTKLTWYRSSIPAASIDVAWSRCSGGALPPSKQPWRVPTRIELVSLIDFTQPHGLATVDPAVFSTVVPAPYWTSSAVPGDDGPAGYWSVDLATGFVSPGAVGTQVLCVSGGVTP